LKPTALARSYRVADQTTLSMGKRPQTEELSREELNDVSNGRFSDSKVGRGHRQTKRGGCAHAPLDSLSEMSVKNYCLDKKPTFFRFQFEVADVEQEC
jgi:hypothetical protein